MEKTDSNVIWVVKLSMTNEPVVYKFNIPQRMVSGNINSFYETAKSNFHIPTEVEVNDEEDKEMNESSRALVDTEKEMKIERVNVDERMKNMPDVEMMQSLGEIRPD